MNQEAREQLAEIVRQYGASIGKDPRRLKALLSDYCGQHRAEVNVLVSAAHDRVPTELLSANEGVPHGVLVARLANRLHTGFALSEVASNWAVESWAIALGRIDSSQGANPEIRCPLCKRKRRKTKNPPKKPFRCSNCKATLRLNDDGTVVVESKPASEAPSFPVTSGASKRKRKSPHTPGAANKKTTSRPKNAGDTQTARPAEEQLRIGIQIALADGVLEDSEIALLHKLRQQLGIEEDRASVIFEEVAAEMDVDSIVVELVDEDSRTPELVAESKATEIADAVNKVLYSTQGLGGDFHLAPHIPEKKLANAWNRCRVGDGELALALIDCTVFGSAKNCVLFTNLNIYWHNGWESSCSGPGVLAFNMLPERSISVADTYEIEVGPNQIASVCGSNVTAQNLLELLLRLQESIRTVMR